MSENQTTGLFEPGERVQTSQPGKHRRVGVFRHIGTNGLAQVMWDGNRSVAYIAPTLIEPVIRRAPDGW